MDLNYEENEIIMKKYIEDCKKQIENTFFSNDIIKNEEIRKQRNEMIDIKLNHTMRVVEDITKMSEKMMLNINFTKVVKVSALLHDIARFNQAVWSDSFNDRNCKEFNGMSHAEYGYHLLYVNDKFEKFSIPKNYKFAISQVVRYHQIPKLYGDLSIRFNNLNQLDTQLLTGLETLNENEKVIVSTLVQMVKDVDMLDILYQHLTGEFPVCRPYIVYNTEGKSLKEISKWFGIDEKEIIDYNKLESNNIETIKIPVSNIEISKLVVPNDIQVRFFNNENIDLSEIQKRQDWTFIVGMWWRLNHFLNNINFTSNLELIKEKDLLDKIYAMYPDRYKPLVKDAFEFSKEKLVDQVLKQKNKNIFI